MKPSLPFLATTLSIIGAASVTLGNPLAANMIWSVSNPALVFHNYQNKEYHQARMFGVFAFLAYLGLFLFFIGVW